MDPHESAAERRWGEITGEGRDPLIGQTISHYRIAGRLGGGGMGVVCETVKAKKAYDDLFILWRDADVDVPAIKQARAEFNALSRE